MTSKTIYDFQKETMETLRPAFAAAAHDARQCLRTQFEKSFLDAPKLHGDTFQRSERTRRLEQNMVLLDFLVKGAQGKYKHRNDEYHGPSYPNAPLWGDYVAHLNCKRGTGATFAYECEWQVEKLLKQNGPKKMQQRLNAFTAGKIKKALKDISR